VTAVQDAYVSGLNLPPGNYVSVGEPFFTLVTTTTWRITGNFLETGLARIKTGQKAVIRLQTYLKTNSRNSVQAAHRRKNPGNWKRGCGSSLPAMIKLASANTYVV